MRSVASSLRTAGWRPASPIARPCEHQARRPDRRQALEQGGEHRRGGNFPIAADAQKIVDQMAGTRRRSAEEVGRSASAVPSRRSSALRRSRPTSGLSASTWKWRASVAGVEPGERRYCRRAWGRSGSDENSRRRETCRGWRPRALRSARGPARCSARDSATHRRLPASSRTLTVARSTAMRACSMRSAPIRPQARSSGRCRRPRSGASGCDRGCSDRDRPRASPPPRSRRRRRAGLRRG